MQNLYLFTIEVDPLIVGESYDPLPSHLTLISRFKSDLSFTRIASAVRPVFEQLVPIHLNFGVNAVIGPKNTAVHLIENIREITNLHAELITELNKLNVIYTLPEYVGNGYLPHVSKRKENNFNNNHKQISKSIYLIEVKKTDSNDIRKIRAKFNLG